MSAWQQWLALATSPGGLSLLLCGVLLSALCAAWWYQRQKRSWSEQYERCRDLQRDQEEDLHQLQWRLEEAENGLQNLQNKLELKDQQLDAARLAQLSAERKFTEAVTRLNAERQHNQQQVQQLEQAESRLADTFKQVAADLFEDKSRRFQQLSQQQLSQLLHPMRDQLKDFGALVQNTHQQEMSRHAVLEKELLNLRQLNHRLGDEAHQLVEALKGDVKVMGAWGELKLERLLKLAGMEAGREYELQVSVRDEYSGQMYRPDALIKLPDGQSLIIDSKVSLEHYRRFRAATDEKQQQVALSAHLSSIRQHMRALGQKQYHQLSALQSPEFVFMFVPSEPAYLDALQADEQLLIDAQKLNIVLLSPANLLATLTTVASLWGAWRRNENALDIARRAGLLYDKFVGFTENLSELGQRLQQAQEAFDRSFSQLSQGPGNLVRQVEQLRVLGAKNSKQQNEKLLDE